MTGADTFASSLSQAIEHESERFKTYYEWLHQHMPPSFFDQLEPEGLTLITHSLMGLDLQGYLSRIQLQHMAIVLCRNVPGADVQILKEYALYGIKNYWTFVSNAPPPIPGMKETLRVAIIYFTEVIETHKRVIPPERKEMLKALLEARIPEMSQGEFDELMRQINTRFLAALPPEKLVIALEMFFRAKTRDHCQYEMQYHEDWEQTKSPSSLEIMLAWQGTPKYNFLYRLARLIFRHKLVITRLNATYVWISPSQSILIMALGLHGIEGKAAWETADVADFLKELVTMKYFTEFDLIDENFVEKGLVRGNMGNWLRTVVTFLHQTLVHKEANLYTLARIEEDLCRHPDVTVAMCDLFEQKFHPDRHNFKAYCASRDSLLRLIASIDTGHEESDLRRKDVFREGINFIEHTLKTNFYRNNKTGLSFRLDPNYLLHLPYDVKEKFPLLPFAIFFVQGMHFFGFHIRFKDLARGGLRTVFPERMEKMLQERGSVFSECYYLAYTQHLKNKDIPEGGAKGVIFLEPFERMAVEQEIRAQEMTRSGIAQEEIDEKLLQMGRAQREEYLYQSQRSFVNSLLTLVNTDPDGTIRAKHVVDYYKKPEDLYLGPDENMHNAMLTWIAEHAKKHRYRPGGSFISSRPDCGINHKEYGVTSLGVNVYMDLVLRYLGIDPQKDRFTVKISGGPDGDVAGNQIFNLYRYYPKTAKLLSLVDVSGTIYDPEGLDLEILADLFHKALPISHYPPEKLHDGGFLLDRFSRREATPLIQQTLCWKKEKGALREEWISGHEMNQLYRNNVHQTKADIFIPAGGRPRTLHEENIHEFLDSDGKPTSRAIVEGANLYLTQRARDVLEKLSVLIIKDSSANKCGVICSSFEVLCTLTLEEAVFLKEKPILVAEILEILKKCARDEGTLLLQTHQKTGQALTLLSNEVSRIINAYTDELLQYLEPLDLNLSEHDPLMEIFLRHMPPSLRQKHGKELLEKIPDTHKKAVIACQIASRLCYKRGLSWSPSVLDILPLIIAEMTH